jgi:hypothetical protein
MGEYFFDDSRSNPFKERGDDENQPNTKFNHAKDLLEVQMAQLQELGQISFIE